MAKEFGVTKNTVWNRFHEMKKSGLINGSTVQINYRNLGYDCVASLLLQVDPSKVDQTIEFLEEIPDVFGPFKSASKYNLRIVVTMKNLFELESLKKNLEEGQL